MNVVGGLGTLPVWVGWKRLPRDARDTLFQLAVIGWTMLPHAEHLPFWCSAMAAVLLAWRAAIALSGGPLPGRKSLLVLMVIAGGLTLWTERTLLGKEAGVTMLVVLLALKTLELRARRDALVVFFLGFFLVLTQCLYSQSLVTAAAMGVSTWGLLTAQVLSSMPVGKPPLKRAAVIAARSALLGLPLMAALFVLFPRIGPLWGLPQDAIGRIGLSGSLRLGGLAAVANDDSIAFRVRFADDASPPSSRLYFRGPVLSLFNGDEWSSAADPFRAATRRPPELRTQGPGQPYEMIVEPIRLAMLPLLEVSKPPDDGRPLLAGWATVQDAELRWQTERLIAERVRLSAQAWTIFEHGPRAATAGLLALTRLPAGRSPRSVAWARELKRSQPDGADADALAAELLRHIRTHDFSYTLQPGTYGREAVDEFWFGRRQGFCEHFAASFVVMMRAMGVPARIVTGYQGAEPADADGWRVVRQSHAHAWAEYWQPGVGWRRADPTAAVAPERIDASRPLAPVPGLMAGALMNINPEVVAQLRRAWELIDNRWNQWVMSYSRTRQFDLLEWLGFATPSWGDLLLMLLWTTSATALAAAAWAWWDRHRVDPWLRMHLKLRGALKRIGVDARPHEAPRTLAERVRHQLGAAGEPIAQSLDALDVLRYGPGAQRVPRSDWLRQFERRVGAWRRSADTPAG